MLRLVQWLIFGHIHHWEILSSGDLFNSVNKRSIGIWWQLRCTKCGVPKYKSSDS